MRRLGLAATQLQQQAAHLTPDRLPQAVLAASNLLSAALGNQQVSLREAVA
jgi:hypothetical protein